MLWSPKTAPIHDRWAIGVDLNASRVRAEVVGAKVRSLTLDAPDTELLLFLAGDRCASAGLCGVRALPPVPPPRLLELSPIARPVAVMADRPPYARRGSGTWSCFDKLLAAPVTAETDAIVLAFPAYLTPAQVTRVAVSAARSKLPLKGTAVGVPLVADRAVTLLAGKPAAVRPTDAADAEWVVPLRPAASGPGAVLVLDVDEVPRSPPASCRWKPISRGWSVRPSGRGCWR